MRNYNFSRTLFQLFALGLFVYQFQNSIIKYITGPITTQTSTTTLDEIEKPLIYLCQEGQFNYTEAKKIGYGHLKEFTMGKLLGSGYNYTWNGRYGNISYHEIQDRIYNNDYSNVSTWNSETGDLNENGYYYVDTKMVYFAPLGFCLNMLNITKKFTDVAITEKSQLYLVDRAGANRLRMYGSNVAKILFGPTDLGEKGIDSFFNSHQCNQFCSVNGHWSRPKRTRSWFPKSSSTSMMRSSQSHLLNLTNRSTFQPGFGGILEEDDSDDY